MSSNKLLIDEPPLQVLPSLAEAIGLNDSIIVQQMHYWIRQSDKLQHGRVWTYNTYESWKKQFPFWSIDTIQRIILRLEKKGILLSRKMNVARYDHTKWYTIDHKALNKIIDDRKLLSSHASDCGDLDDGNLPPSLTETTETTSDISPCEGDNTGKEVKHKESIPLRTSNPKKEHLAGPENILWDYFKECHKSKIPTKPIMDWFPFKSSVKKILKGDMDVDKIKKMMDKFFNDPFQAKLGFPQKNFWGGLSKYAMEAGGVIFEQPTKLSQNQIEYQNAMKRLEEKHEREKVV